MKGDQASPDADLFDDVMARLWRVRERLGDATFRAAARAAIHAIARAVLDEAERRTRAHPRCGRVADFPLSRIIRRPTIAAKTPCERPPPESNPDK